MVAKKSIFERLGIIESTNPDEELLNEDLVSSEETEVPEPEHVPDLTKMTDYASQNETQGETLEEPISDASSEIQSDEAPVVKEVGEEKPKPSIAKEDIPKDIGDKLDLIIGAYEKNKLMTIEEIYRNSNLNADVKKTIFMTDVYLKAIPENLPLDVKRETVLNIMQVSNISLDDLLNDAYKRIDSLNTVLEETVSTTQDVFERNEATINELQKRIEDLKEINANRRKFQEDQNTMIEYEIQKIINLVEFVKPKK